MVAQPFKRGARLSSPGKIDASIGEFWVPNPWDIVTAGHNLSNHERQRLYLNAGGAGFFDLSFLSGADAEGDGRCAVAADFRNNGRLDVVVRKVGGSSITIYQNQLANGATTRRHYLEVSLRGRKSNRLGIGARLTAEVNERKIVRELYPINSYMSQAPCRVHFGLGDSDKVTRLTVRWPSGLLQVLNDLSVDRHIVIDEGVNGPVAVETVVPGTLVGP